MKTPAIKIGTSADEESIISVLTLAFGSDPMTRWVYPDPQEYLRHFMPFVRAFGGEAFANGTAFCVEGYDGAALWLPPGTGPDEETMMTLFDGTVSSTIKDNVYSILEEMGQYHPEEPHWYLPLIGVDPSRQNQGYGSELMKHALSLCDRENQPAYLESSNPRNIPLYQRHGFEIVGEIQSGSSPTLYPMLRKAR